MPPVVLAERVAARCKVSRSRVIERLQAGQSIMTHEGLPASEAQTIRDELQAIGARTTLVLTNGNASAPPILPSEARSEATPNPAAWSLPTLDDHLEQNLVSLAAPVKTLDERSHAPLSGNSPVTGPVSTPSAPKTPNVERQQDSEILLRVAGPRGSVSVDVPNTGDPTTSAPDQQRLVSALVTDILSMSVLALAAALAIALIPALEVGRRFARDRLVTLEQELAEIVERPLAVRAGHVRAPNVVVRELEDAYDDMEGRVLATWLGVGFLLTPVVVLLARRHLARWMTSDSPAKPSR